jgi:putative thioredoxin
MLGPLLERLADEYAGQFLLVKADTDQLGDIAAAFGVQGIPAVFALKNGEIVDQFVGVQPERVIREWLDKLLPSPAEKLASEARSQLPDDAASAASKFREALALDPNLTTARIGLARALIAADDPDSARAEIAHLERRGYLEPEAEQVKAELILLDQGADSGGLAAARAEVEARPGDLQALFHLAEALASSRQYPEALALCLDLVERDRPGVGEQARQTMLAIFNLLPPGDPLAADYRRKLSFVL